MKTYMLIRPNISFILYSSAVFCLAGYQYGFRGVLVSIALITVAYVINFHREKPKISFNDVVSSELMRIRHEIADIKILQGAKGFPKSMPKELIRMWMVYHPYNSIIIFHNYGPFGEKTRGTIAIILDNSFDIEDLRRDVNAETLIRANTFYARNIKKGDRLQVFYWEPEFLDECKEGRAVIKSIEEDDYDMEAKFNLTLEIEENDNYHFPLDDSKIEKKIVELTLYGKECRYFIADTKSEQKKEADRRMEEYKKRISA